jgi:enolase
MRIEDINIREVLTTNLQKTVEAEIKTKKGSSHSIAPINKNGIYRIRSLPAEDLTKKFLEIKRHFVNQTFDDIQEVDKFLHTIDISVDFREIGGNLAFAISSAFLKAFAKWDGISVHKYLPDNREIPVPLCVITNKEKTQTDFKEYMLYPVQQKIFPKSIMKLTRACSELKFDKNMTNEKVLRTLASVTTKNSLQLGINFGASDIWNDRRYTYSTGENLTPQEQLLLVQDIAKSYPVGYIEEPFHEDEFLLSAALTHRMPTRLVVGNELYSNNFERFKRGIELKATSAINISPTQMGTISDVMNMVGEAKKNNITTVVTGEVDDNLISNLAVGLKFDYIKLGMDSVSVNRMNELIRIENKI